jgi:hypothetical protein
MTEKLREQKTLREQLKTGLIKDFNHLYVKKYSSGWKIQRFVRRTEINLMSFDNTIKAILQEVESARLTDCDYTDPKDLYFNIKQVFPEWDILSLWEQERIAKTCNAQLEAVKKILGKV